MLNKNIHLFKKKKKEEQGLIPNTERLCEEVSEPFSVTGTGLP